MKLQTTMGISDRSAGKTLIVSIITVLFQFLILPFIFTQGKETPKPNR